MRTILLLVSVTATLLLAGTAGATSYDFEFNGTVGSVTGTNVPTALTVGLPMYGTMESDPTHGNNSLYGLRNFDFKVGAWGTSFYAYFDDGNVTWADGYATGRFTMSQEFERATGEAYLFREPGDNPNGYWLTELTLSALLDATHSAMFTTFYRNLEMVFNYDGTGTFTFREYDRENNNDGALIYDYTITGDITFTSDHPFYVGQTQAVPLPGAVWLLALALPAAFLRRR